MLPIWVIVCLAIVGIVFLLFAFAGWYTTQQGTARVVQRLGKHKEISLGGFRPKIPLIDSVVDTLSMRVTPTAVTAGTITKDQVEIQIGVAPQYRITDPMKAFYELRYPESSIQSWVESLIRAEIPKMELEEVYANKDRLSEVLKRELNEELAAFGWTIVSCPVNDVTPDKEVVKAMSAKRAWALKAEAATAEAEAVRIKMVGEATAEAQAKALQGKGVADMRLEIAKGMQQSAAALGEAMGTDVDPEELMHVLMLDRWIDMQEKVASTPSRGTKVIFTNTNPNALNDISAGLRGGMLEADAASDVPLAAAKKESGEQGRS